MPIYNSVTATKKINELTEEIQKLNEKLNNTIKNQLNEREGFMEVVSSLNLMKIEQFKILEELNDIRDRFCQKPKLQELSTELSTLLDFNGLEKYAENLKFIGISTIDDILLLDTNDFTEHGVVYFDSKKIIAAAKMAIENRDTLN
jgi:ERCC4-related helicase